MKLVSMFLNKIIYLFMAFHVIMYLWQFSINGRLFLDYKLDRYFVLRKSHKSYNKNQLNELLETDEQKLNKEKILKLLKVKRMVHKILKWNLILLISYIIIMSIF